MKKALSVILAVLVLLGVPAVLPASAADTLVVTNSLHLFSAGGTDDIYATYTPLEVSVGDILEVRVSAKFKTPVDKRYITGMRIGSFFSDTGSFDLCELNSDQYLTFSCDYAPYNGGFYHYAPFNGTTFVNAGTDDELDQFNCFVYTFSNPTGESLDVWTQLYSFTLRVNQGGVTHIDTAILDMVQGVDQGYMVSSDCMNDMDYKMDIEVVEHEDAPEKGDVNGDGLVTIDDATMIQLHLAEYTYDDGEPLLDVTDEAVLAVADVTGDGKVSVRDVTAIQRYVAEFITEFA